MMMEIVQYRKRPNYPSQFLRFHRKVGWSFVRRSFSMPVSKCGWFDCSPLLFSGRFVNFHPSCGIPVYVLLHFEFGGALKYPSLFTDHPSLSRVRTSIVVSGCYFGGIFGNVVLWITPFYCEQRSSCQARVIFVHFLFWNYFSHRARLTFIFEVCCHRVKFFLGVLPRQSGFWSDSSPPQFRI